ncbi:lysine--tRNA ligase [Mesorhizobium sp. B2-3-3]|uniref:Lysine--tRNA ligase n=1 Tax=Streptomyces pratensis (strain ATCC 33331 / IAF-45CD) TaxID=591167 RepID=A0A8D3WHG1_STRFA|nr:lysyl-tRNA synthetase class 1 [Streptomyces pratensis]MYT52369.1 lysine--tRNA ligase [Streptomyces sp. SID7815]MYT59533.1 lysine--tRNA ligase [Streptomyces sp. SID7834]RAS26537.1 lysyl-tRNA synthetase class I [Streptomyces avidinii]TPN22192.1 lysine--tRNA ligase [Mesorhizobium sp. B2-3-3]SNX79743.1 lysyl-tRNA synthetase, class I [Streptomyces microflavus]
MASSQSSTETDWVSRFADDVIAESERRAPGKPVVVASGLSPSGPIHLGNLREVMTPHLVADEIRRRGHTVRHLISWDDYDRYRKVPNGVEGVDDSWQAHIGKPLTSVPAPAGSAYPNWAEHFKAAMTQALDELGVEYDGISQTEQYLAGTYREQVLHAMRHRADIDAVLDRYRTKKDGAAGAKGRKPQQKKVDEAELEAAEGSGAADEDDGSSGSAGYFPYKPYCGNCEKDLTVVTSYDDDTTELNYTCSACGFAETVRLNEFNRGKLVWKVDWPMRWAYEGVIFEPSGVDHSSPGSSFVVGGQIVREVFDGVQPIGPMYAFVGISGMAKMSSSKGGVPTPADALKIMEAPLLRWLYARRKPNQSFKIAFDQEIQRLYDEWDSLARKVADGTVLPADAAAHARAVGTAAGELPSTPRPLPYRTLASVADITAGAEEQTLRILSELDPSSPLTSLDEVRPRLDRAENWITTQVPAEARTVVRHEPDKELLGSLDEQGRESLRLLLEGLDSHWSLDGLTTLVYGVPKVLEGLAPDAKPTPELKVAQRSFFALLYRLLVGRDTGPRLPTLLLAVGADRVRTLLGA